MLGKTQSDARPKILVLTQFIPACRILLLFVEEDYLKLEFNSVSSKLSIEGKEAEWIKW